MAAQTKQHQLSTSDMLVPIRYNQLVVSPSGTEAADGYLVTIPVYEGPLDLLLQLIERAELDITRVALAQVTDQYLSHMRAISQQNPDEVSAFLVIAAKLIQIKSEALLPRPPEREAGEEDPGEALARQLRLYKQYKQIGGWLKSRDEAGLRTYLRLAAPPRIETRLDLDGIELADLIQAAQEVFTRKIVREDPHETVIPLRVTIREKINLITSLLSQTGQATFRALLGKSQSRVDIVVTFLALLELVKQRRIDARQLSVFGEIELEKSERWDEDPEFELEFGE